MSKIGLLLAVFLIVVNYSGVAEAQVTAEPISDPITDFSIIGGDLPAVSGAGGNYLSQPSSPATNGTMNEASSSRLTSSHIAEIIILSVFALIIVVAFIIEWVEKDKRKKGEK